MPEQQAKKPGLWRRLFGAEEPAPSPPAPASPAEAAPAQSLVPENPPAATGETRPAEPQTPIEPPPSEPEAIAPETGGVEAAVAMPPAEPVEASPAPVAEDVSAAGDKKGWWRRLKDGLQRTSSTIGDSVTGLFTKRKLDAVTLEGLEDVLIQADLGVETATRITEAVGRGRYDREVPPEEVKRVLAQEVERVLTPVAQPLVIDRTKKPYVILMSGVNGAGKTTTIGKLAQKFRAQGLSVMLVAGDTFRAAAIEQLKVWGERTGAPVLAREQGADAAGLAYDGLVEARARGIDVVMIDTAGRLQNKVGLMAELEKVIRVLKKLDPETPHATLLVLDATVGQNALSQVDLFGKAAGITGLVMTKLDGTARGGILVALAARFGLPVHFIGVGEGVDDLEPFAARDFARAIAGLEEAA